MSRKKIEAGEAYVGLGIRSKLKSGLSAATARLRAFGAGAQKIGGMVAGIGAAFIPAISAASEFQERFSKFQTVFGDQSKSVKAWGDEFAGQVGRSKSDIVNFLASTQDLLVPLGLDPKAATETSKQITMLATDLASFNNMNDADALRDIQAALTGSGEVMKKYGVIVSQAAVKQELLNTKIDPKSATEAQKAMARLSLIMKGTTAAQGDAVKTSGSFANRMKALKASFSDLLVEAGKPLLDMLAGVAGYLVDGIRVVSDFIKQNHQLVVIVAGVAAALFVAGSSIAAIGAAASVAGALIGGFSSLIAAITSPIGLIVGALAIGGFAFFRFTDAGKGVLEWFSKSFGSLISIVSDSMGGIFDALKGGDLDLAAEIAMTGVKLVIAESMQSVGELFGVTMDDITKGLAEMWKKLQQFLTRVNSARQQASNAIADFIGQNKLLRDIATVGIDTNGMDEAEFQKQLKAINQRNQKSADNAIDAADAIDTEALADKISGALNIDSLRERLEALKTEANNQANATPDQAGPDFNVGLAGAMESLRQTASVASRASLDARSFARGGPGARSIDKKLLDAAGKAQEERETQTQLLREIKEKPSGNFG